MAFAALRLSHRAFRRVTLAVVVLLIVLIGSGGWVRLSGSGLGCPTWPQCYDNDVAAHASSYHSLVEFTNRCVITAVGILIAVAIAAAILRRSERRDLFWLSLGLGAGYVGEAILGGITVLAKLAPELVACHLVLAMVLLADAVVLHWRAGRQPGPATSALGPSQRELSWLGWLGLAALSLVVIAGTVATGSGPHSGNPGTERLPFRFSATVELHAVVGMFLFGVTVATYFALRSASAAWTLRRSHLVAVGAMALQGVIGYAQYFSGMQVGLVEAHIVGAALTVVAVVRFNVELSDTRYHSYDLAAMPAPSQHFESFPVGT